MDTVSYTHLDVYKRQVNDGKVDGLLNYLRKSWIDWSLENAFAKDFKFENGFSVAYFFTLRDDDDKTGTDCWIFCPLLELLWVTSFLVGIIFAGIELYTFFTLFSIELPVTGFVLDCWLPVFGIYTFLINNKELGFICIALRKLSTLIILSACF